MTWRGWRVQGNSGVVDATTARLLEVYFSQKDFENRKYKKNHVVDIVNSALTSIRCDLPIPIHLKPKSPESYINHRYPGVSG